MKLEQKISFPRVCFYLLNILGMVHMLENINKNIIIFHNYLETFFYVTNIINITGNVRQKILSLIFWLNSLDKIIRKNKNNNNNNNWRNKSLIPGLTLTNFPKVPFPERCFPEIVANFWYTGASTG